jgi:hypothetical protein
MYALAIIFSLVLALLLAASAASKFTKNPSVVQGLHGGLGVPLGLFPFLGTVLLLGAAGLVVGIWVEWISVIAAIGVIAYFGLGFLLHLSKKDVKGSPVPLFFVVLAVLELVFRTA